MSLRRISYLVCIISKFPKTYIVFISDIILTLFSIWCVFRINTASTIETLLILSKCITPLTFILIIQAMMYYAFGLYRGAWRFASMPDLIRIIKGCIAGTVIIFIGNIYLNASYFLPNYFFMLFCLFTIYMLSGSRLIYRWLKENHKVFKTGKRVLIIGAGCAGESIVRELKRNKNKDFCLIGLIDDDSAKLGLEIHGIRVLGSTSKLGKIVKDKHIELILIAIPTAKTSEMRRIINLCIQTHVSYRTLPSFNDIANGHVCISNIREVLVEDLLSRDAIQFNKEKLYEVIGNKKILVTGAGGSIGSELCRQIAECHPHCIILIEHSEYNLFQIQSELQQCFPTLSIHHYLVSITNKEIINKIMKQHKPDYVFHAAAYKHVPLLEPQIRVAIENNIFGTEIVAEAAVSNHVKKFILVSTDKAVNPTNVMGASKRCAEMICECLNRKTNTKFLTVRFGNVLGSTGSVIPLFKQQIAKGGPVTVTHPDMERYFMTMTEAAQLIIQTVAVETPGNLYVLDMGEPVKIQYLAEQMIKLSGHIPNVDIKIIYSGLRPGEKINEELFYANEHAYRHAHDKIMHVDTPEINYNSYTIQMTNLHQAYLRDDDDLKKYLFDLAYVNRSEPDSLVDQKNILIHQTSLIPLKQFVIEKG